MYTVVYSNKTEGAPSEIFDDNGSNSGDVVFADVVRSIFARFNNCFVTQLPSFHVISVLLETVWWLCSFVQWLWRWSCSTDKVALCWVWLILHK